jgi:3-methyladenine DNA glycosylase Tag
MPTKLGTDIGCCAIQNMLRVIQEDLIVVHLSIVNEAAVGPAGAQHVGFLRMGHLPASTPQADTFAKQLKSQGYRFVRPTSVYAFMQNNGVVNDHIHGCFRAEDYIQPHTTWERGAR